MSEKAIWIAAVIVCLSLSTVCSVPVQSQASKRTAQSGYVDLVKNNTSAADSFKASSNGNMGADNVSKVDIHTLLYPGATTKIFAHLMLWWGGTNHINIGYSSTDKNQIHKQIKDMISRGIDGVIIDWYGPNNSIDTATKLVMAEAERHPGFMFSIMVDTGAIKWDSCSGCNPQQALIQQLQYLERTYFPSKAYFRINGAPAVSNFSVQYDYSIDWNAVSAALSSKPAFIYQNKDAFTRTPTAGGYSWVQPTLPNYGLTYLDDFYKASMGHPNEYAFGATYKGYNDTIAPWGSQRIMSQVCGQTWLQTFAKINSLYNSGNQLPFLQLVTWNDYEEGTEIESGIDPCFGLSASASGNTLSWTIGGNENVVDHYAIYDSLDGTNLTHLADIAPGNRSVNLCSYSLAQTAHQLYVHEVSKPGLANRILPAVKYTPSCLPSVVTVTAPATTIVPANGAVSITLGLKSTYSVAMKMPCTTKAESVTCSAAH